MVFIRDVIAREEEYLNGMGSFVDSEGNIRASVIGNVRKDPVKKIIYVDGKISLPKKGDVVFAVVTGVKEKVVLLDVQEIKGKNNKRRVLTKKSAIIFIANLSQSFLDNPRQALKIGDLVKAELIDEDDTAYILSMKDEKDGVFLALCSRCRSRMCIRSKDSNLKDGHVLVCPKCGSVETRKTAQQYLYDR